MLSDWMPKTTGEQIRVDGGFHALGAEPVDLAAIAAEEAAAKAALDAKRP
jgi:enoyl-[acyl-carrier protein] reductase I